MGVSYTVHSASRAECLAALIMVCARLGLQATLPPVQLTDDRWIARAVPVGEARPARR